MTLARFVALAAFVLVNVARGADAPAMSAARTPEAAGFISIQALVPDMQLDMRYAAVDNFVGARIDGYEAPRCYLLEPVAMALARVERTLRAEGMRLKVFDCYRPARAVRHFVRWAHDLDDQRTKASYYPSLDKTQLLGEYISPTSGHSRGATLDLTLMRCDADRCVELDMGTRFDFFDALANTDSPAVTESQRENRQRLRVAMEKEGFLNYEMEWWHYTFQPEPSRDTVYDFVVR